MLCNIDNLIFGDTPLSNSLASYVLSPIFHLQNSALHVKFSVQNNLMRLKNIIHFHFQIQNETRDQPTHSQRIKIYLLNFYNRCEPKLKSSRQHSRRSTEKLSKARKHAVHYRQSGLHPSPHLRSPTRSNHTPASLHLLNPANLRVTYQLLLTWAGSAIYSILLPQCQCATCSLSLSLILHSLDDLPCVIQQRSFSRLSSGVCITLLVYYACACTIVGRVKAGGMWLEGY
jgi:hypothetical protein